MEVEPEVIHKKKHAGGRPKEYREDYPELVVDFIYTQKCMGNIPTRAGFSTRYQVTAETLLRYEEQYPKFSEALSLMRSDKENALLQRMMKGRAPFVAAMFLLKNHHGYKDQQDVAHTVGEKQTMMVNGQEVEF